MNTPTSTRPATTKPTASTVRTPLFVRIAAWSIPVLVLGQFAMLAVIPVAVIVTSALVNTRTRGLRWWAGLLAVAYTTPLVIWALRADPAPSLSKDLHPAFTALIVAASVALLIKIYTRHAK